ncbi:MAG: indolepyruvate ferredoxin oxidoreductase subunit alpha [Candidatus Thorarchaeota archaeon]
MVKPGLRDKMMSGNEAIARGALEAGVGFCSSYPGTPSTEITTTLMRNATEHDIYVEWSVNEKVALEAATGASWVGIPALCPMKSLGLNVAADFLLNLNLSGIGKGGLVVVVCDDPRGHSSSNEQDSRFYAKAAYLPLLEPSTCQQAKDIIPYAFELSRKFAIPVIVRSTTRLSHSRAAVSVGSIPKRKWKVKNDLPEQMYNVPNPHLRHRDLLEKLELVSQEFENCEWNNLDRGDSTGLLTISTGVCHKYVEEAAAILDDNEIGRLSLVTTHPLPKKFLLNAMKGIEKVLFAEEIDPFVEDAIRSLGVNRPSGETPQFCGKQTGDIPAFGEMNTDILLEAIARIQGVSYEPLDAETLTAVEKARELLFSRSLTFCAACTHRNVYWAIRKVRKRLKGKLVVAGDIGCYSLGLFYDKSMNTMQAMGSGIGTACGLGQLGRFGFDSKVLAVAGDSTFFHACIPALVNAKHKNANITFVIMDNATTAMTGFQSHPGSSEQAKSESHVSIEKIVNAIGADSVVTGDASDIPSMIELIHKTVLKKGLHVIILASVCRLEEQKRIGSYDAEPEVYIDLGECSDEKCRICVDDFGCTAISWDCEAGHPVILEHLCVRCGACIAVCPYGAIRRK